MKALLRFPTAKTRRKSAPFRVGYLRACGPIRPITGRPSLPPTSFTRYSVPLPCGRATTVVGSVGLTQLSMEKNADRLGWSLYPGGSVWMSSPSQEKGDPTHLPFGHGLSALLAVSSLRGFSDPSLAFNLPILPWSASASGLAGAGSLSPELRTSDYSFARPGRDTWTSQGSLGGIATSFTTLLDRPCGWMCNVHIHPLVALGLLRGLRRPGARTRQAISRFSDRRTYRARFRSSTHPLSLSHRQVTSPSGLRSTRGDFSHKTRAGFRKGESRTEPE